MKRIAAWIILCELLCGAAYAEYAPGTLMEPPREVLEHLEGSFSQYTLEDYCEVDTPEGEYGFALLHAGDERLLVGYEEKAGKMAYWLKSHGAVMQGEEEAWFNVTPKGKTLYREDGTAYEADGLSFSVECLDDAGESYQKYVAYHWEDGGFKLTGYKDWDAFYGSVAVEDGSLHFGNYLEGWDFGRAYGTVQRDLRYVSFDRLPKTVEEARRELSSAPDIESFVLNPKRIRFTGGRNYPVFTGPGESFARSGNGKGSVSTNDWIQVFGEYDGWILIQYDISASQYRFGWIESAALPGGAAVEAFDLHEIEKPYNTEAVYDCELTDDPIKSRKAIARIPKGTAMTELIYRAIDGWSYVVVTIDGKTMCGFVPSDAPIHG